jgi:hypothetical protein
MAGTDSPDFEKNDKANQPRPEHSARRSYCAPRVLGAESLEAAAATCNPPAPPFGKSVPFPCSSLGS